MADGDAPVAGPTIGSGDRLDKQNKKEEDELKKQKDEFNKKEDELEKTGSAGIPDDSGTNSNPDGETGGFVFANLDELDGFIQAWMTEGDSIGRDGTIIQATSAGFAPPALDPVTADYVTMLSQVFQDFMQHNRMMFDYNGEYVDKLSASRTAMLTNEQNQTATYQPK